MRENLQSSITSIFHTFNLARAHRGVPKIYLIIYNSSTARIAIRLFSYMAMAMMMMMLMRYLSDMHTLTRANFNLHI